MPDRPTFTFRITDPGDGHSTAERCCGGTCKVISRSGLSATEAHLAELLPLKTAAGRLLVLGNRTGALALMAAALTPGLQVDVSTLDVFHLHAVERNLARNPSAAVTARCEADIAERGAYDVVCLQASRGTLADELLLDLLQQSHQALKLGGCCHIAVEEKPAWLAEQVRKLFGKCTLGDTRGPSTRLMAVKKHDLASPTRYRAEFTMTLPGRLPVTLATVPGVFAHRRVDPGAQALAEVVETRPHDAILDMGCGCGSIGVALARNEPTASVCFVDSHARAVAITEANSRANGLERFTVVLADQGLPPPPRFTLFVGNPPYYSHDRIADVFMRTAFDALLPGGRAYVVAKHAAHHLEFMRRAFGNGELLHRRGYEIVRSVQP